MKTRAISFLSATALCAALPFTLALAGGNHGPGANNSPPPGAPGEGSPKSPSNPRGKRGPSGSVPGPSTPRGGGPAAPPRSAKAPITIGSDVPELQDWSWWWTFNGAAYMDLRRRVRTPRVVTGDDDFFIGQLKQRQEYSLAPDENDMREQAGPALLSALEGSKDPDVRAAALVALAKLYPNFEMTGDSRFVDLLITALGDPEEELSLSAILGLGLTKDPQAAMILADLVDGGERAQKLVNRSSMPELWRVHAAFATGIHGTRSDKEEVRRFLISRLTRIIEEEKSSTPDLHVACVTAIGLMPLSHSEEALRSKNSRGPLPSSSRLGQIQFLGDLLHDLKRKEVFRAHIPKALGLLAADAEPDERELAARYLIDHYVARKKSKRLVRYGIVEGLGILGDADNDEVDREIRDLLHKIVKDGDAYESNLALISIALASSHPGQGSGDPLDALSAEQVFLMKVYANAKNSRRPWVALALGLQGYHARQAGREMIDSTSKALRWTFERTRSAAENGAFCLAFGLRQDLEAVPAMLERLSKSGDDAARGRIAISLGMLGAKDAIEPLQEIVRESRYHPALLRDAAIGLALLDQKDVAMEVLPLLDGDTSLIVRHAAVTSIGFIGDARVVAPLVELVTDDKQKDVTRASAATALGLVCEPEPYHWSTDINHHLNYSAMVFTLVEPGRRGFMSRP